MPKASLRDLTDAICDPVNSVGQVCRTCLWVLEAVLAATAAGGLAAVFREGLGRMLGLDQT